VGQVAYRGERRQTALWYENLKERDHWEVVGVDGRKMLTSILKKQEGKAWI